MHVGSKLCILIEVYCIHYCIHQLQQMMIRNAPTTAEAMTVKSYSSLGAFSAMKEELGITQRNFDQWAVVAVRPAHHGVRVHMREV